MISDYIIPLFILLIVFYGIYKKVNIYDCFLEGVGEGLKTIINIIPPLIAMIFAINILLSSEVITFLLSGFSSIFEAINIPQEILPMAILRPISGTASLAVLSDILINYGPDSFIGRLASTLQGCTDTTIYVLALYFSSIKVTKIRYSLKVGLFADLVGIIASFVIVKIFFL